MLSDYYGRVRVLTWTILLFAVFTGLGALAQGYWDLLVYRTIAGLGLGGEFGIGMALVAEAWPAKLPGARVHLCGARLAGRRAGGSAHHPDPSAIIGWRGMFVAALVPGPHSPLRFAGMCRSRRYSWIAPGSAGRPCRSAFS